MAPIREPEAVPEVGRFLPARRVAELLRLSVAEVEELAARYNVRVLRVVTRGKRPKIRVEVEGLQRAIQELSRKPLGGADRAELAIAQTLEHFGLNRRERPR